MSAPKVYMDEAAVALLRATLYAASRDAARPVLQHAHFSARRVMCTDAYRMAVAYFDGEPLPDALVDARALRKALPRKGDWEGELVGDLAPYDALPVHYDHFFTRQRWTCSLTVRRVQLLRFLDDAAARLPKRRDDPPTVEVLLADYGSGARVRASVSTPIAEERATGWAKTEVEEYTSWLGHPFIEGEPFRSISFSLPLLRDLARVCTGDWLTLDLDDPAKPALVREAGISHLLMPRLAPR